MLMMVMVLLMMMMMMMMMTMNDDDDNESHWRRLVAVDTGDNSFSEQQLALKQ